MIRGFQHDLCGKDATPWTSLDSICIGIAMIHRAWNNCIRKSSYIIVRLPVGCGLVCVLYRLWNPYWLTCDIGNDGEAECSCLSGSSLCTSHQISALQADWNRVPLDRSWLGVLASLHICCQPWSQVNLHWEVSQRQSLYRSSLSRHWGDNYVREVAEFVMAYAL